MGQYVRSAIASTHGFVHSCCLFSYIFSSSYTHKQLDNWFGNLAMQPTFSVGLTGHCCNSVSTAILHCEYNHCDCCKMLSTQLISQLVRNVFSGPSDESASAFAERKYCQSAAISRLSGVSNMILSFTDLICSANNTFNIMFNLIHLFAVCDFVYLQCATGRGQL